ncbi:MAG: hypothetical protein HY660_11350, partial [Armatimonadetes bacterium]|nr:hypothetical protein [Armatimonadota bacterium]
MPGRAWRVLLIALAMTVAVPYWGAAGPSGPRAGGQITYAQNIEPNMLDVHVGNSRYDRQVSVMLYDQLLFLSRDSKIMPWLAES